METLPPLIEGEPRLTPVMPPSGPPVDDAPDPVPPPAAAAAPRVSRAETLDFVEPMVKEVPLRRPFRRNGEVVATIQVRPLITAEVAALVPTGQLPDLWEVYAVMTGFPSAVLCGLDANDGQEVAETAADFLPPLLRQGYGLK